MTVYQIELGALAQGDMTEIIRYIGQTLHEPQTAETLYQTLKDEILSLDQFPERYPYEDDDRLRTLGIRKMLVKNYKVLYLVDTQRRLVQIARVVYAGRDIARILEETDFESL